ncbi:C40 family peptidase [Streptomyces sp. NPDC059917]|uniref:C40 family peptidase n=1 Tax=Streptomyces sp. NPDC059917 TaxID=3347002 RepID=UPI00365DB070
MITTIRKPRHAKPRSRTSSTRVGVLGGVLGTLALAATATPASAHQADSGPTGASGQIPSSRPDGAAASGDSDSSDGSGSESVTGAAAKVVAFARAQVGKAYVMGGTGPNAYDCSGLTQAAYRQAGVDLPRVSQDQSASGRDVALSDLRPGDLLYWGAKGAATHVAVYLGNGTYVGAQNSRVGVVERSLDWSSPSGAVRVL